MHSRQTLVVELGNTRFNATDNDSGMATGSVAAVIVNRGIGPLVGVPLSGHWAAWHPWTDSRNQNSCVLAMERIDHKRGWCRIERGVEENFILGKFTRFIRTDSTP